MKKEKKDINGKETDDGKLAEAQMKAKRDIPQNVIEQNIGKNRQQIISEKDLNKSDVSSLSKHNHQYTKLLKTYVKEFKINSKNKSNNKESIFIIAKRLLTYIPLFTCFFMLATLLLLALNVIDFLEAIPGLLTALVSLIGTFMVIPQMITEYLFDKDEEKHLAEIISRIQEYDRDVRGDYKN